MVGYLVFGSGGWKIGFGLWKIGFGSGRMSDDVDEELDLDGVSYGLSIIRNTLYLLSFTQ